MKKIIIILSILLLCVASPALAHKVRVFAYQNGGMIVTETNFSGGKAAKNAKISALVGDAEIASGKSDDGGIFSFPLPDQQEGAGRDITIVAKSGDGHQASWVLLAKDLTFNLGAELATNTPQKEEKTEAELIPVAEFNVTGESIRKIVQEELARELAPIKRDLSEKKPSLQDILGGIGYIFGIFGIAAYLTSRKKS